MPLLGFTKLKDKLLDGSKLQTIRKPRKYPLKVGDKLYVYWKPRIKECEKLGEAVITKIERKQFCKITTKDAILDGFTSLCELRCAFQQMHSPNWHDSFDIITFEWTKKEFE
jgi:hypothetical protein